MSLQDFGVDFVRLGRQESVHASIHPYLSEVATKKMATVEQVKEYYESRLVIAASCMGAANFRRSFDYCIVDEASQLVEVSAGTC